MYHVHDISPPMYARAKVSREHRLTSKLAVMMMMMNGFTTTVDQAHALIFVCLLTSEMMSALGNCLLLLIIITNLSLFSGNANKKRMARLFTRVRACQVHHTTTTAIQAAGDPVFCVVLGRFRGHRSLS